MMEFLILIVILLGVYSIGYFHGENDFKKYLADKATGKGGSKSFKVGDEWLAVTTEEDFVDMEISFYEVLQNRKQ